MDKQYIYSIHDYYQKTLENKIHCNFIVLITMSWKQYGGTNNLENMPSININNLSVDSIRFQGEYEGNFDICGNINGGESLYIRKKIEANDIVVGNTIFIRKDLRVEGSIYSNKDIFLNLGNFKEIQCIGNAVLSGNTYMYDRLYLDSRDLIDSNDNVVSYRPLGNIFFKGNSQRRKNGS